MRVGTVFLWAIAWWIVFIWGMWELARWFA
jgi:hypothetical protein